MFLQLQPQKTVFIIIIITLMAVNNGKYTNGS